MTFTATLHHFIQLCINEIKLIAIMYKHYKWSYIINVVMTAADFIWWMILIEGGTLSASKIAPLALGYIVWAYANYIIYDANNVINETSQTGVLEQIYISSSHIHTHLLVRCIAGTLFCTIEQVIVLSAVLLFCPLAIPISFPLILTFLLTVLGIFGFAFMVAGIGLIFKRSQPFCYMINNILLFLNGAILPIEKMPYIVQLISKTLPTTQGIELMRAIAFGNQNFATIATNGSLLLLIVNTSIYLVLGWLTLSYCERYAQQQGIIGQY